MNDNENMEAAKTIYKILKNFESQLDSEEFKKDYLDYSIYKISEVRFFRYLQMLLKNGFIEGLTIEQMADKNFYIKSYNPQITLKGIEYLAENSTMQKAVNIIKEAGQMAVSII